MKRTVREVYQELEEAVKQYDRLVLDSWHRDSTHYYDRLDSDDWDMKDAEDEVKELQDELDKLIEDRDYGDINS